MSEILLDTCAVIWTGSGTPIADSAVERLDSDRREGRRTYVSPFTAWELGMLVARSRLRLTRPAADWFEDFVQKADISLASLSPRILAESASLPGSPPADPADRILISTARAGNLTILSRDRAILSYAAEGYVRAMEC